MTLDEIVRQFEELQELAETHPDIIPENVIQDTIEALQGDFEDKALEYMRFTQNQAARPATIRDAVKRMEERARSIESRNDKIISMIAHKMEQLGLKKIAASDIEVYLGPEMVSVTVIDENKVPSEFIRVREMRSVDKVAVKLAGGCDGVRLVMKRGLRVK